MTLDDIPQADLVARIREALELAEGLGAVDGAHHKQWVIDQMVRSLLGQFYASWVEEFCDGEDGPHTYEWDTGIAP